MAFSRESAQKEHTPTGTEEARKNERKLRMESFGRKYPFFASEEHRSLLKRGRNEGCPMPCRSRWQHAS
ncbi:Uncharacterized protein HZ326_21917 [Fusarium oxysporum f. sp. albedinis]|nr:Uncharacterized protein HZ326_21917 [Fusarium oxysporum f. sp. albedinis]